MNMINTRGRVVWVEPNQVERRKKQGFKETVKEAHKVEPLFLRPRERIPTI